MKTVMCLMNVLVFHTCSIDVLKLVVLIEIDIDWFELKLTASTGDAWTTIAVWHMHFGHGKQPMWSGGEVYLF